MFPIHVLLAIIVFGITECRIHVTGSSVLANETCVNVSSEIVCFFKGSEEDMSWNEARQRCNSFNSTLLVIRNRNDQDVAAKFVNSGEAWTAGESFTYSNWTWIDGAELDESLQVSFPENRTLDGERDYAAFDKLTDFNLQALSAFEKLAFICQYNSSKGEHCSSSGDITVNGKRLRIINGSETWYDARNQCIETKGDLAIISDEDRGRLKTMTLNQRYWIGLRKKSWRWNRNNRADSNDEIKYTNFEYENAMIGECINIDADRGKWTAVDCTKQKGVVCQRGKSRATATDGPTSAETFSPSRQGVTSSAPETQTSAETIHTFTGQAEASSVWSVRYVDTSAGTIETFSSQDEAFPAATMQTLAEIMHTTTDEGEASSAATTQTYSETIHTSTGQGNASPPATSQTSAETIHASTGQGNTAVSATTQMSDDTIHTSFGPGDTSPAAKTLTLDENIGASTGQGHTSPAAKTLTLDENIGASTGQGDASSDATTLTLAETIHASTGQGDITYAATTSTLDEIIHASTGQGDTSPPTTTQWSAETIHASTGQDEAFPEARTLSLPETVNASTDQGVTSPPTTTQWSAETIHASTSQGDTSLSAKSQTSAETIHASTGQGNTSPAATTQMSDDIIHTFSGQGDTTYAATILALAEIIHASTGQGDASSAATIQTTAGTIHTSTGQGDASKTSPETNHASAGQGDTSPAATTQKPVEAIHTASGQGDISPAERTLTLAETIRPSTVQGEASSVATTITLAETIHTSPGKNDTSPPSTTQWSAETIHVSTGQGDASLTATMQTSGKSIDIIVGNSAVSNKNTAGNSNLHILLYAVVIAVIPIICLIGFVVCVVSIRKRQNGQLEPNDSSEQMNHEESFSMKSYGPVNEFDNEPANPPVKRSDDTEGEYPEIALLCPVPLEDGETDASLAAKEQLENGGTKQPGIIYVSLEFKEESMEVFQKRARSRARRNVGPLRSIYAMPLPERYLSG